MANKEIQLHDENGNDLIPVTCLSSIFVIKEDNTTQSLEAYIKDLIDAAKGAAITRAEELASAAQTAAIDQVKSDLGYSSDENKVTFSKAIASDSSVEDAVWN